MSAIIYSVACEHSPRVEIANGHWYVDGQDTGIAHDWRSQSCITSREGDAWVVKFYSNTPCNCGSQMPNTMCSVGSEFCG